MKIISGILLLATVYFGITHGMRALGKQTEASLQMMAGLGITDYLRMAIGIWSLGSALLILFPASFFLGNVLRAMLLVLMMGLALKAGDFKFALIEIPFLMMPLALIYLGHPFKDGF